MFPLLPFAAGLLVGAATIKILRGEKTQKRLDQAQDRLRKVTVNSLSTIEQSSARLRDKLQVAPSSKESSTIAEASTENTPETAMQCESTAAAEATRTQTEPKQ